MNASKVCWNQSIIIMKTKKHVKVQAWSCGEALSFSQSSDQSTIWKLKGYVLIAGQCAPSPLFGLYVTYIWLFYSSINDPILIFSPRHTKKESDQTRATAICGTNSDTIIINCFQSVCSLNGTVALSPAFMSLMWDIHHNSALERARCSKLGCKQWLRTMIMILWKKSVSP